jgi:hypothetical protein
LIGQYHRDITKPNQPNQKEFKPMTREQILTEARNALILAIEDLKKGDLNMHAILLLPSGKHQVLELYGDAANDPKKRDVFTDQVRKAVRQNKAEAVLYISDTWMGMPIGERAGETILRENLNTDQAAARGLLIRTEAVICSVEAKDGFAVQLTQCYNRLPSDQRSIQLTKRLDIPVDQAKERRGRLFGFYFDPEPLDRTSPLDYVADVRKQ